MEYKKVDGVLKYNTKTRNELLERNGGKYFMLDGQLEHPIGYAYDIRTRNIKHLTNEMPLQKFTIEDYSNYSDKIKFQYFNGINELEVFNTSGFTGEDFVRWHGKYVEYITLDTGEKGVLNKDLGADVVFYHHGYDSTVTSDKQILGRSIYNDLAKWYNNNTPYISDGRSEDDREANLLGGAFDGLDDNGKVRDLLSYKSRLGNRVYNVYGESDVPVEVGYARTIEDRLSVGGGFVNGSDGSPMLGQYQSNEFSTYTHSINGVNNLLKKTDELYNSHKIKTLFGRFHTSNDEDYNTYFESFDSAKVPNLGNPRGRGLLKLGVSSGNRMYQTNGYDDPYCRAWTYHHQYSRVKDMIRPLPSTENGKSIYEANVKYRSRIHNLDQGGKYLHENTVLQDTGFVRITPSASEMTGNISGSKDAGYRYNNPKVFSKLKKYMFSIENLAWGDGTSNNTRNLSVEQLGPNNGRIMWFPPYNLDFKENVNVKWNSHEFIGRGENIYTYSNTTRKATLAFTLLIDHPSIVNSMASGKYDGEEPDKDPEGDILRFFAGCQTPNPDYDVPEDAPPDIRLADKAEQRVGKPKPTETPNDEPKLVNKGKAEKIIFYVFFPNNYSGVWNGGKKIDGVGSTGEAWGAFNSSAAIDGDWYKYLLYGSNACGESFSEGNGYEMNANGKGISDDNGKNDYIKSWSINEDATFIIDDKQPANIEQTTTYDVGKTPKEKWFKYRVDYDLRQSGLKTNSDLGNGDSSYVDTQSFGLNSSLEKVHYIGKSDANYTFAEVFCALFGEKPPVGVTLDTGRTEELKNIFTTGNTFSSIEFIGGATKNDPKNSTALAKRRGRTVVNTIKAKLKELNLVEDITADGKTEDVGAQIYGTINSLAAKSERYARIEITYNNAVTADMGETNTPQTKNEGQKNVVENVEDGENQVFQNYKARMSGINNDGTSDGDSILFRNGERDADSYLINSLDNPQEFQNFLEIEEAKKNERENNERLTEEIMRRDREKLDNTNLLRNYALANGLDAREIDAFDKGTMSYSEAMAKMKERADILNDNVYDEDGNHVSYKVTSVDEIAAANTNIRRYDDEYRFFRRLQEESPLIYKSIVDKIKYFNPAFHSLSPEGFNARLTFLHQCTRQGHTVSASENTNLGIAETAGNLSFGKMPVCVLRIGDFINTKVVIESMSIDYKNGDSMQWDLNQEGAGVQPMFANISMNIVLLGGQSLDGPVNRLQNAVTFNYYANAPVYDDRADRILNNYDGTITYKHLFTPFKEGEF